MTDLLYLTDSYVRVFAATVVAVAGRSVVLDRTAFYPGGGGQPADRGHLLHEGVPLLVAGVARGEGGAVVHELGEGVAVPPVGATVQGELDWQHRYRLMRTHTALHVLCGTVFREYGALVTGGQMYPDRARMDFELADLSPERVADIERRANEHFGADRPVRVHLLPRA